MTIGESSSRERQPDLPALTSVRFFAAAAVLLYHILAYFGLPSPHSLGLSLGIAVDFFFALSGFILAYNYRSVESVRDGLRMIGYRFVRIWPLHFVTLAAAYLLLFHPGKPEFNLEHLLPTILLIQSWYAGPEVAFHANAVAWTLSVEWAFYLTFPVLLVLRARWIVLLTAAVTVATCYWAQTHQPLMLTHPGMFFVLFAGGVLAARLYVRREWNWGKHATRIEIAAATLAIIFTLFHDQIAQLLAGAIGASGPFAYWLKALLGTVFFLPIIVALAVGQGRLTALLSGPRLVYLGEISFALYMCHQLIIRRLAEIWNSPVMLPVCLVLVFWVSALLYRYVERPAQRIGRRMVDRVLSEKRPVAAVS